MAKIATDLVKELRQRTGAGMMDCKKALVESNGKIELAVESMRKSGAIKAARKSLNVTAEGVVAARTRENHGVILEINCQTDFVANNADFRILADKISDIAITQNKADLSSLRKEIEEDRVALVIKFGEHINVRRMASLEGDSIGSYQHGSRISVLVAVSDSSASKDLLKQLAMHIAATSPEFIRPEDVPAELVEKECAIQLEIAINSGKPKEIAQKMVQGRIRKFKESVALTSQPFVIEPSKSVGQVLKEHKIDVTGFIRFQVGEAIEKSGNHFASEVNAMVK